jgi:hypothetical protein
MTENVLEMEPGNLQFTLPKPKFNVLESTDELSQ